MAAFTRIFFSVDSLAESQPRHDTRFMAGIVCSVQHHPNSLFYVSMVPQMHPLFPAYYFSSCACHLNINFCKFAVDSCYPVSYE